MAHQFDPDRLELIGDPVPVAEQIAINTISATAAFSVSRTGQLAYRAGSNGIFGRELGFVDRDGKPQGAPLGAGERNYQNPVLSPDEQTVAVNRAEQGSDIWILDRIRGGSTKFTFDPANDDHPLWSPDGKNIVFSSNRDGGAANLYEKPSGGAGQEQLLLKSDHSKTPTDWSRDGSFIIYEDRDPATGTIRQAVFVGQSRRAYERGESAAWPLRWISHCLLFIATWAAIGSGKRAQCRIAA